MPGPQDLMADPLVEYAQAMVERIYSVTSIEASVRSEVRAALEETNKSIS